MFPTRAMLPPPTDTGDDFLPSWMEFYPAPLFAYPYAVSPPPGMDDLAVSLQGLTFDLEAIGRELHLQSRDTDQIRQDFIRNGIDSSVAGKRARRAPPGFYDISSDGPLSNLENRQAPVGSMSGSPEDSGETTLTTSEVATTGDHGRGVRRTSRRKQKENEDYCVFCFNNHEPEEVYLGHALYDSRGVQCPRLRRYVCPYCQATDRKAHTKKYCPSKPIITPEDLAMQNQQQLQQRTTVSARVLASATASIRACQPTITPGGGKRALRF